MTKIVKLKLAEPMQPTPIAKLWRTQSMYLKGKAFLKSAYLLKQHSEGLAEYDHYVFLHLLCCGLENIQKSILLFSDYEKYSKNNSRLLRDLGHDLLKTKKEIYNLANLSFNLPIMHETQNEQLNKLTDFYKASSLKYGTIADILIDPSSLVYSELEPWLGLLGNAFEPKLFSDNNQSTDFSIVTS